jgi:ADP-heptose:LPS heptosyltransferase
VVARWACRAGYDVVLTGSGSERPLAEQVALLAGLPDDAVLAGRTDLAELAATVATARLVVCGDTGMAHLATAYRRPSVVLFGPTPPSAWGPPPEGPHEVVWHGTQAGDPWGAGVDPALAQVTVEEVLERAEALLARTPPAAPAATAGPTPGSAAGRPRG